MVNWIVFYIAIVFFTVTGCAQKRLTGGLAAYELAKGESVSVNGVIVTVTDIKESRCPMNARCIRAREATAQFTIHNKQKKETLTLCTGADCRRIPAESKAVIAFDGAQYELDLKEIIPNPTLTLKKQVQKVVFSAKKTG